MGFRRIALAILSLTLIASAINTDATDREELLIGWQGETFVSPQNGTDSKSASLDDGTPWIETISWKPRAFVYHNLLTSAECDHLVKIGQERVSRSMVVDAKTGASKTDDIRTSYGAAFGRGEDPIIATVEEKIAEWTHVPPENGEQMQILRYEHGQKYDAHWDWFDDPVHHKAYLMNGNRYATVLLYLSEVEEGGETSLPLADAIDETAQQLEHPSPCASKSGIAVRAHKGDALLFFDMDISGAAGDRKALHASCPTTKGMKWTATKWIHNKKYMGNFNALEMAGRCMNIDRSCASRAAAGECESKPDEMTGSGGVCRKACKDCVDCPSGDIICMRRNMRGTRLRENLQGVGKGGAPQ